MSDKPKFPRAAAVAVAKELCDALKPHCSRLIVAGSLRRRRAEVGDVEILYVPTFSVVWVAPNDFFAPPTQHKFNDADAVISTLLILGKLRERENVRGSTTWGEKNKLALHIASGIPVDLFSTTEEATLATLDSWVALAESNVAICNAAIAKGWKWKPYDRGFCRQSGLGEEWHAVTSEREVFEFVGLPYREPWER